MKRFNASEFLTSEDESDFLGRGSYASVRRCHHKELGDVVVKCFNLTGSKLIMDNKSDSVENEAKVLIRLDHKNIIKVFGLTNWSIFFGIVMEEASGFNFEDMFLHELDKDIPWPVRLKFLIQIADGLEYLYYHNPNRAYIHGDLKLQNILLNDKLVVKIADFGSVSLIHSTGGPTASINIVSSNQHTWLYSAPELLKKLTIERTCKMDVYSYAMIGYEIMTRKQVFLSSSCVKPDIIQQLIRDEGCKPNQDTINDVKRALVDVNNKLICNIIESIVIECWQTKPNDRPSIKAVKNKLEVFKQSIKQKQHKTDHLKKAKTSNKSTKVQLNRFEFPFEVASQFERGSLFATASTSAVNEGQKPAGEKKWKKHKKLSKKDVGFPFDFTHSNHVEWNQDKGYDFSGVDSDFKQILEDAGLIVKSVQDEKPVRFIDDFHERAEEEKVVEK